jgi:hypothetical protein
MNETKASGAVLMGARKLGSLHFEHFLRTGASVWG